jgi:hypothetical protein
MDFQMIFFILALSIRTPFFGLTTSWKEIMRTLAEISEIGSIRGVARSSGHDKSIICKMG